MPGLTHQDICEIILKDTQMMECINCLHHLGLPDSWIGAGFIRNKIWDLLHAYNRTTPLNDIDVIYYSKENTTSDIDREYERILNEKNGNLKWSVKNQARMHLRNNDEPYLNTEDAIAHWTETATSIAIQKNEDGLKLIAPYGLSDLSNLILRPTPYFRKDNRIFFQRIRKKQWLKQWPNLTIIT